MTTGKCANCEQYSEKLNEREYCLECASAYEAGYEQAKFEIEGESKR